MAIFAPIAALAAIHPASAETLRIGGTGSATEMLRQIGPAFEAATGVALHVVPSLGTSGGNAAVADGVLDASVAGRDLKPEEVARGLVVAATLRTPFGFVTSRQAAENLASGEIAGLYRSARPLWPDGTPIRLILRPTEESDNAVLGALFPGMSAALKQARTRGDLSLAATDQDNAEMAERIAGSLVGASFTQMTTEKRKLRFVSIDGVLPSLTSYENGSYPYGKSLYIVVPAKIGAEAAAFVSFIATPEGKGLLRQAGIVAGTQ
nr:MULTISPECIES: substrate-binding domain-containing protein [Rhodomicrobium]